MSRALIAGANGFVGAHLARLLASEPGLELFGSVYSPGAVSFGISDERTFTCDVLDLQAVMDMIGQVRPDRIFNLAGQADVARSWEDPACTIEVNLLGPLHLVQAILKLVPRCRLLLVGSANVYGRVSEADCPIAEDAPLAPASPYAVSKAAQELLAAQYHMSHDLQVVGVRPFNHIGPGQSEHFIVGRLAKSIAEIEAGLAPPVLRIGDLTAKRDFTDVRDVARAYVLLMERGVPGEIYNVASGRAVQIKALVEMALSLAKVKIELKADSARARPLDLPLLVGDSSRLTRATGWRPTIPLERSLADAIDHARAQVGAARSA